METSLYQSAARRQLQACEAIALTSVKLGSRDCDHAGSRPATSPWSQARSRLSAPPWSPDTIPASARRRGDRRAARVHPGLMVLRSGNELVGTVCLRHFVAEAVAWGALRC